MKLDRKLMITANASLYDAPRHCACTIESIILTLASSIHHYIRVTTPLSMVLLLLCSDVGKIATSSPTRCTLLTDSPVRQFVLSGHFYTSVFILRNLIPKTNLNTSMPSAFPLFSSSTSISTADNKTQRWEVCIVFANVLVAYQT